MPMNKHLIDIDVLSWNEYTMWDLDWYVSDPAYFFDRADEKTKVIQYSQIEFKDMPTTLCTLYGNMNAMATRTGKELTKEERRELCNLRKADPDYNPEVWWYTSAGCDTVRRWWNTHNPDNKIVTFAIDVTSSLWKKFFAKNFPVATSVRLNAAYSKDNRDGMLDATSWGTTTGGHCRMRMGMKFYDNYIVWGKWRMYEYPSVENYMKSLENGYERVIMYAFFLEKELSGDWKKLVNAMRAGLWNWEREDDLLTRFEAKTIAMRIGMWKVIEKDIWNGRKADDAASKYEYSVMMNRANKNFPIYLWTDRNQFLTRKQAILMLP